MDIGKDKKIKIVMVTNHLSITGIGTVIMNYCEALNKDIYEISIISGAPIADKYMDVCKKNGITLIEIPMRHGHAFSHYRNLFRSFKKDKYDIVHVHGSSPLMANELVLAQIAGIKKRIAHCHSNCPKKRLYQLYKPFFNKMYTVGISCSESAGRWLFEKEFIVLPNKFNTTKFRYREDDRTTIRENLGIQDYTVIGHVGRMNDVKNQQFLLDVFRIVGEENSNVLLLLVGIGPDFDMIKESVRDHPFKERIVLYGEAEDVAPIYSAMDLFVFPSKYEGFGLVMVEAEISGLPCLASVHVPSDIVICDNVEFLPIEDGDEEIWAKKIREYTQISVNRETVCSINREKIEKYDSYDLGRILTEIYESQYI